MMYLIHYKNLCKCHSVPPPSTTIKEKKKKEKTKKGIRVLSSYSSKLLCSGCPHPRKYLSAAPQTLPCRPASKTPHHSMFQLRTELFLCDFKIKETWKERRQCETLPSGVTPEKIDQRPLRPRQEKPRVRRPRYKSRTSLGAGCDSCCLTSTSQSAQWGWSWCFLTGY
jgi:hypothetical protein